MGARRERLAQLGVAIGLKRVPDFLDRFERRWDVYLSCGELVAVALVSATFFDGDEGLFPGNKRLLWRE
jgi:hypothetical protein